MGLTSSQGILGLLGGGIWSMIADSGLIAQLVLLILAVFSVVSWAVIFMKWKLYRRTLADGQRFRTTFRRGKPLVERLAAGGGLRHSPHGRLVDAGVREATAFTEVNRGSGAVGSGGFDLSAGQKQAVADTLTRVAQEEAGKLEAWTIFLATTANVSPFLGLLGTVWGIIDAFVGIGASGSASLAVVAPGIAEALISTVAGLAAAIPAVVGYNWCVRKLREIGDDLSNLSLELLTELTKENAREAADLSRAL